MSAIETVTATRDVRAPSPEDLRDLELSWSVPVLPLWSGELRITG